MGITKLHIDQIKDLAPIDIEYLDLLDLVNGTNDNGNNNSIPPARLISGRRYRITNYATYYFINTEIGYEMDTVEPLIVTAEADNKISPIAFSERFPTDIIHYTLDGGGLPEHTGWIIYRECTLRNIKAKYDWRYCKTILKGPNENGFYSHPNFGEDWDFNLSKKFSLVPDPLQTSSNKRNITLLGKVTNIGVVPTIVIGAKAIDGTYIGTINKVIIGEQPDEIIFNDGCTDVEVGSCTSVLAVGMTQRLYVNSGRTIFIGSVSNVNYPLVMNNLTFLGTLFNCYISQFYRGESGNGLVYNDYSNENLDTICVTYEELSTLIGSSDLVTNAKYKITNFCTKYLQPWTNTLKVCEFDAANLPVGWDTVYDPINNTTGCYEPLIVTAISNHEFDNIAISTVYPTDEIYYDFNDTQAGVLNRTGRITRRTDTVKNISLPYDYRRVVFMRYASYEVPTAYNMYSTSLFPSSLNTIEYNGDAGIEYKTFGDYDNSSNVYIGGTYDYYSFPATLLELPNLVFKSTVINTRFDNVFKATFGSSCRDNKVNNIFRIAVDGEFNGNLITQELHDTYIQAGCEENIIQDFHDSYVSGVFSGNRVLYDLSSFIFIGNFNGNTFLGNSNGHGTTIQVTTFNNNIIGSGFLPSELENYYILTPEMKNNVIGADFKYSIEDAISFNNNYIPNGIIMSNGYFFQGNNVKYDTIARSNTSIIWDNDNTLLKEGEFGYEKDTNKLKIGPSGGSNWRDVTSYLLSDTDINIKVPSTGVIHAAGMTDVDPVTLATGLNISIATGTAIIYNNDNFKGLPERHTVPMFTGTLIDNSTNYLTVIYNDGDPIYHITGILSAINESNCIPVNTILTTNGNTHLAHWDRVADGAVNKLHRRFVKTQRYARESGLSLSTTGTSHLVIGEGVVWRGIRPFSLSETRSDGTNSSTWFLYYKDNGGNWTQSVVSPTGPGFNYTKYSGPSGLVDIPSNLPFNINWIYRGVEDHQHAYVVLSTSTYKDAATARGETALPALPDLVSSHAILVGRVICERNNPVAAFTEGAFDYTFSGSIINDHNDLGGLQGGLVSGTSSFYYHLNQTQHTDLTDVSSSFKSCHTPAGFINLADSIISVSGTTTAPLFKITGVYATGFDIYCDGKLYTKYNDSVYLTDNITDTPARKFIYYSSTGVLTASDTAWNLDPAEFDGRAFVATILWNHYTRTFILEEERHHAWRDIKWHHWAHDSIGSRYASNHGGMDLTYPTTTTGNLFSINGGTTYDEDITNQIVGQQTTGRMFYPSGVTTGTVWSTATAPYLVSGTTLQYNNGIGSTSGCNTGRYVAYWVYATNSVNSVSGVKEPKYAIVVGTANSGGDTLTQAQNAAQPTDTTLGFKIIEWKLIYKFIFQQSSVSNIILNSAIDYRNVSSLPAGAAPTTQVIGTNVIFAPTGSISAVQVQAAIEELDVEKVSKGAVTGSGLTINTDKRILGRDYVTGPTGIQELSVGTGLTISGSTLFVTGISTTVQALGTKYSNYTVDFNNGRFVTVLTGTGAATITIPDWASTGISVDAWLYVTQGPTGRQQTIGDASGTNNNVIGAGGLVKALPYSIASGTDAYQFVWTGSKWMITNMLYDVKNVV